MAYKPKDLPERCRKSRDEVDRFILDEVDSVPHLEALLLLWRSKPKAWSVEEMGRALYIPDEDSRSTLEDLRHRRLAEAVGQGYVYNPPSGRDHLIQELNEAYRHELVRISRMIHSKPSSAVREFARAFRLKKD